MKRSILASASIALALLISPVVLHAADGKGKPDHPARISFGQEVEIKDFIVEGKTTIVDFTSKFCPPCERISPLLDKLHANREDIVVVKVDINRPDVRGIDWKSPVARQYELNSIPHFKVFGPDGKLQAEGDEAYAIVNKLVSG